MTAHEKYYNILLCFFSIFSIIHKYNFALFFKFVFIFTDRFISSDWARGIGGCFLMALTYLLAMFSEMKNQSIYLM